MDRKKFLLKKIKWLVEVREKLEVEGKAYTEETLAEHIGMIIDEYLEERMLEAKDAAHIKTKAKLKLDLGSKITFHTADTQYIAINRWNKRRGEKGISSLKGG